MNLLRLVGRGAPKPTIEVTPDGKLYIARGRWTEELLHYGPNVVRALITHEDGSIDDLGPSPNLITNGGKDFVADALGGRTGFGISSTIATASSSTSITATGTPFVASAYIGQIVVAEESTNAPVWATIVSNTTSALTVDAWKNGDGSAGNTPGSTANFEVLPGMAIARYMALTADAAAASASDTALASELTTNGLGRALATYAHTAGTTTYTLVKAFAATGTQAAIHKMGIFAQSTASSGPLLIESVLNADASVVNGDTLTVTDTVTLT